MLKRLVKIFIKKKQVDEEKKIKTKKSKCISCPLIIVANSKSILTFSLN